MAATFRATVPWFLASVFSLVPFYALWAMPFTYRALDAGLQAINARTLYEAARSMGASPGHDHLPRAAAEHARVHGRGGRR